MLLLELSGICGKKEVLKVYSSCGDPKLRNLKVYSCWLASVATPIHRGPKAPLGDFRLNI